MGNVIRELPVPRRGRRGKTKHRRFSPRGKSDRFSYCECGRSRGHLAPTLMQHVTPTQHDGFILMLSSTQLHLMNHDNMLFPCTYLFTFWFRIVPVRGAAWIVTTCLTTNTGSTTGLSTHALGGDGTQGVRCRGGKGAGGPVRDDVVDTARSTKRPRRR